MNKKELEVIKDLIDDIGWEYDRMSGDGQKTYKKLCKKLGWDFEECCGGLNKKAN